MFEKIFKFENYYIFKTGLQKIEIRPKKPNLDFELIEINFLKELDNLIIPFKLFDNFFILKSLLPTTRNVENKKELNFSK